LRDLVVHPLVGKIELLPSLACYYVAAVCWEGTRWGGKEDMFPGANFKEDCGERTVSFVGETMIMYI
jgi:hypothetical protein